MKWIKSFWLFFVFPISGIAQTREQAIQSLQERKGWYAGIGIYWADQNTYWKYDQTPPSTGTPFYDAASGFGHDVSRALFTLGVERKSLFGTPKMRDGIFVNRYDYYGNYVGSEYDPIYNFIDFDFGADLMLNPSGKTTADWLNDDNNQISSGGLSVGASAYIRFQWIVLLSSKLRMTVLSTAIGTQFMYINNNGKDVVQQPLVSDFNYDKGWNEKITTLYLSVGTLGFETGKLSITPEVRVFALSGTSSTSLKPERLIGDVKKEEKPSVVTYGIKIMRKL